MGDTVPKKNNPAGDPGKPGGHSQRRPSPHLVVGPQQGGVQNNDQFSAGGFIGAPSSSFPPSFPLSGLSTIPGGATPSAAHWTQPQHGGGEYRSFPSLPPPPSVDGTALLGGMMNPHPYGYYNAGGAATASSTSSSAPTPATNHPLSTSSTLAAYTAEFLKSEKNKAERERRQNETDDERICRLEKRRELHLRKVRDTPADELQAQRERRNAVERAKRMMETPEDRNRRLAKRKEYEGRRKLQQQQDGGVGHGQRRRRRSSASSNNHHQQFEDDDEAGDEEEDGKSRSSGATPATASSRNGPSPKSNKRRASRMSSSASGSAAATTADNAMLPLDLLPVAYSAAVAAAAAAAKVAAAVPASSSSSLIAPITPSPPNWMMMMGTAHNAAATAAVVGLGIGGVSDVPSLHGPLLSSTSSSMPLPSLPSSLLAAPAGATPFLSAGMHPDGASRGHGATTTSTAPPLQVPWNSTATSTAPLWSGPNSSVSGGGGGSDVISNGDEAQTHLSGEDDDAVGQVVEV